MIDKSFSPSIFATMRTQLIAACLALFPFAQTQAEEEGGKLKKARDQVRPSSTSSKPTTTTSTTTSSGQTHSSSSRDESSGWSLLSIFFSDNDSEPSTYDRTSNPAHSYQSHSSYSSPAHGLLAYPYADGEQGWLVSEKTSPVPKESLPPGDKPTSNSEHLSIFGGNARGEYTDGDDGLKRYAGAIQISFNRLRLETEWQRYLEHLPSGKTDSLTVGTLGIALAFPVKDSATITLGTGACFYHDPYGDENGWYGKVGLEVYPIRPLIVNAEIWGGYVSFDEYDENTFIGGGRATAGVIWNRFELYGGWQATWIESVTLSGPTAGLRVWF